MESKIESNTINFGAINPFEMDIKYIQLDRHSAENQNDSHIHAECEIYINLTGDVSFMVENRVYPVSRGSAIITRPHEYHHCIYHSDAPHELFWILFAPGGNEELLDIFFEREKGENNLIVQREADAEKLISLCFELLEPDLSHAKKHMLFLSLICMLKTGKASPALATSKALGEVIRLALEFADKNISTNFTVKDMAKAACVSVNTLERHFAKALQLTPAEFVKKKRLEAAAELLKAGKSVMDAGLESGFCDNSHFISLFKATFGVTPLKYKKLG